MPYVAGVPSSFRFRFVGDWIATSTVRINLAHGWQTTKCVMKLSFFFFSPEYSFPPTGHEDLRQDERVMQLFGLVNALLERDRQTKKHDLRIQRYAISPLSHNCGLVGWVPHTDTLHSLIRDYRQSKKTPLNLEHREMLKIAPDYDLLTVMQKVEVFTDALR